jgi:hypothetical protein
MMSSLTGRIDRCESAGDVQRAVPGVHDCIIEAWTGAVRAKGASEAGGGLIGYDIIG